MSKLSSPFFSNVLEERKSKNVTITITKVISPLKSGINFSQEIELLL